MPRLRTVSPSMKGFSRRRAGSGWVFFDEHGDRITDADEVQRIKSLAIPPAWRTCGSRRTPTGTSRPSGTDDAGRRQYLYHPVWRVKRDKLKFDRVLQAARKLPAARRAIKRDLGLEGMPRERAEAVAVRLLDLGYFRIGSDVYADTNGSYGLTTLEKRHVRRKGTTMVFHFTGKSGIEHSIEIDDPEVIPRPGQPAQAQGRDRAAARLPQGTTLGGPGLLGGEPLPPGDVRGPDRQGLPHLARHRDRGGGARRLRGARRHQARPSSARSRRPSRRSRSTSATPPPSRGTPTSTPASSTSTRTAPRSTRRWCGRSTAPPR